MVLLKSAADAGVDASHEFFEMATFASGRFLGYGNGPNQLISGIYRSIVGKNVAQHDVFE